MEKRLPSGLWIPKGTVIKPTPGGIETARITDSTSKFKEREQQYRKSLLLLRKFYLRVARWQKERPALLVSNQDLELLTILLLGEIPEVLEHRELEGLPGYDFKSEKGEVIDVGFFISALTMYLSNKHEYVDFDKVLLTANGQSKNSKALDNLMEVAGNLTEKSLSQDVEYIWTLWVSYLIHMKYPVDINQVLTEYTLPKNDGNYIKKLLSRNPLFEKAFGRKMDFNKDKDAYEAYFSHYRKATRLIRDFLIIYIDPSVEHTGLKQEHYEPYELYIYNFMKFEHVGISPQGALELLEVQLYKDFGVVQQKTDSQIQNLFEQIFGRKISKGEENKHRDHLHEAKKIIQSFLTINSDPNVELQIKQFKPYQKLIYHFMYFEGGNLDSDQALIMLKLQLQKQFNTNLEPIKPIKPTQSSKILRLNTMLPN